MVLLLSAYSVVLKLNTRISDKTESPGHETVPVGLCDSEVDDNDKELVGD